ncbi:MAG: hypothetical protein UY21_C0004G0009 [Microgenomates group bacterium GW2011_GWA1_48_10]|nr:MAG: hypothetical protein UY21_C0004G0009 [Microgenomates group bacterium GW2011_GWA1_48_10]
MVAFLLIVLAVLYFLGYIHLPALPVADRVLFHLFRRPITLYDILVFAIILALIDLLPSPFQEIAAVLLLLWLLSFFGVITIFGFSNVVVLVVIFGLIYYLLTGGR